MRQRRIAWMGLSLSMGLAIVLGACTVPVSAQDTPKAEPAKTEPAKAEAPTPTVSATTATPAAPAAPVIDPGVSPTGPDSSGAGYVGASTSAALTKDGDKVTPETIAKDVKHLKLAVNIMWALITGFLVMFMQSGFALLETGLTRGKNVGHTMGMNFVIYAVGMLGFWAAGFAIVPRNGIAP